MHTETRQGTRVGRAMAMGALAMFFAVVGCGGSSSSRDASVDGASKNDATAGASGNTAGTGGASGAGGAAGAGGAGGAAAPAAPAPTTDVGKASQALADLLAKPDAAPAEIKTALEALRSARAKVKVQLEEAQKALKAVLTIVQEAKLVQAGTLD
jgi:hypothetical protein